ncbi:pyruvate formate lyase activating enzyme [Colletotrichum tofieldiae]|uniref:Pyruvate formate lyase activating enzyme n=1 Tax=Colletotrichum tofieldiae TaxID=708197 RepID=A0A166SVU0_9PEZI|nr:pyruvate formate lyase activating enzyme [Colletotrichum tofieldiae]
MDQYVEAPAFIPLAANNHDAMTTSSEDSSSSQPSCQPYRKGSDMFYPEALPSPLRPALRLGCTSPKGSMNTNTKQRPGWSAFTSPNSYEHLYTERAYLTASLKNQGDREVDLMRKLSILQEKIDNGLPSDERRKSRKKTALLKSKIMEAAAQKKAVLLRLSDIYVELQSRETWMQIQSEVYERRYSWWSTDSPGTAYVTTPSDVTSMIPTPLDTVSPIFFPMGCHPIYNTWDAMTPHSESQLHAPQDGMPPEVWAEDNDAFAIHADELGNHGLRFEYKDQMSLQDVNGNRNQPLGRDGNFRTLNRRMSLPSLKCLWPVSESSRGLQVNTGEPLSY